MTLVLEPLNTRVDHAGYYLETTAEGVQIVDEVGSPAVRLLFDAYHAAVMGEDVAAEARAHAARIGHVHVADAPGRHEPGTGQVDYRGLLRRPGRERLRRLGRLEFRPVGDHHQAVVETLEMIGLETGRAGVGGGDGPRPY